jgi:hypothetical protein
MNKVLNYAITSIVANTITTQACAPLFDTPASFCIVKLPHLMPLFPHFFAQLY